MVTKKDEMINKVLIVFKQILFISTLGNVWRTVQSKRLLMLGCRENLFHNEEVLMLVIIPYILKILMCDSGVIM